MFQLLHADCRQVMANMGDATIDACVSDPPYHLTSIVKRFGPGCAPQQYGTDGAYARAARGFMGQTWDGGDIAFDPGLWAEVFRVLKPGGYVLAFGGTRTYHRMAVAIEDAGFEIRDMLAWLYGSGFPKSHDFAAESKANGERILLPSFNGHPQADGWGTAIKPAQEPICMARKPLIGSVAANVLEHGTGGLNIDGCRVAVDDQERAVIDNRSGKGDSVEGWGNIGKRDEGERYKSHNGGRFPANVLHDGSPEVLEIFPAEAGAASRVTGQEPSHVTDRIYGKFTGRVPGTFHNDSGSAARFFYCAKASKRDREEGLEHLATAEAGMRNGSGRHITRGYEEMAQRRANTHPTVKPTDLMRWLCRLVTPPGGVVFDPFTGSGSTGKAALLEGFEFIGAEKTAEYIPIAEARLFHAWHVRTFGVAP